MEIAEFGKLDSKQVSMANELVRAAHGLSLQEKRLLMLAVSKLDSSKPALPDNMILTVSVLEMISEFGIDKKSAYKVAREATEKLMNRYIRFHHVENEKTVETRMQWVGQADYKETEGLITLHFWYKLAPMLFALEQQFTSYKLSRAGALQSKYSWRLFELVMQFKTTGYLIISLEKFNLAMETPKSYMQDFGLIRTKILEKAVNEISRKDGLKVTWKPIKKGRKVVALEFKFPVEPQYELFKIDKGFIDKHARPGESYEQAEKRLKEETKKQK